MNAREPLAACVMTYPSYALFGADYRRRVEFVVTDNADKLAEVMGRTKCTRLLVSFPMEIRHPTQVAAAHLVQRGMLVKGPPGWFALPIKP